MLLTAVLCSSLFIFLFFFLYALLLFYQENQAAFGTINQMTDDMKVLEAEKQKLISEQMDDVVRQRSGASTHIRDDRNLEKTRFWKRPRSDL